MHPIERLRHVARAEGAGPSALVAAAAGALAGFGDEPAGLVTACRRLVERHPTTGPMWWLAARVTAAADPVAEAWRAAAELEEDPTAQVLAAHVPGEARVCVIGWSEVLADFLVARGDLDVLVIDTDGDGEMLVRRLRSAGSDPADVAPWGLGAAVKDCDAVLLEAEALGPGGFVARSGSAAASAVARQAGAMVWLVAGAGRVLPGRLWEALVARMEASGCPPWDRLEEIVPLDAADQSVGPGGVGEPGEAWRRADCPVAPELLRPIG